MTHDRSHPARHRQSDSRREPRRAVNARPGRRTDVSGRLRARRADAGCGGRCRRSQHLRPASDAPAQRPHHRSLRRHHDAMGDNVHPHPPAADDRPARNGSGRRRDAGRAWPRTSATGSAITPTSPNRPPSRWKRSPRAWCGPATAYASRVAPTDHRPVEPTIGFRIEFDGASVVLAGDTVPCASLDELAAGAGASCTP